MVQRHTIDAIRERADLVEVVSQVVTLKRKGTSHLGLCPFHQEKSPSFNVVPHKGIFHCFGCGEGGDVFRFVMKTRGISFMDAVKELGQTYGIAVEERPLSPDEQRRQQKVAGLHDVVEIAAQYFHSVLQTRPEGRAAREYLTARGVTPASIATFRLGFAPDSWDALLDHLHRQGVPPDLAVAAGLAKARERGNGLYSWFRGRLMIPIMDARGRVCAFGGRVMQGDGPKYINSPESEIYQKSRTLFALSQARNAIQRKDRVLVVEGYFDVISLHQAGFEEAVAACGTSLTVEHLATLQRLTRKAIALFDADAAGVRAAVRSLEMFLSAGIEPLRLELGDAKDPDEYIVKHGGEAFDALVQGAEPLFNLVLRDAASRNGNSPQGRQRALEEVLPALAHFSPEARTAVAAQVASALFLREDIVLGAMARRASTPAHEPSGGAEAAMRVEGPRWSGTKEINHLLWLLIHFPEDVGPVFVEMDPEPEAVSDRGSVLSAVAMLSQGVSLNDVLDRVEDADLARVLRQAAARDGLYVQGQAAAAARQILAGMAVRRLDEDLARVGREIEACQRTLDESHYIDLFRQRQNLHTKKQYYLNFQAGRKKKAS